ncbi:conserved hypothetical protein, partial [Ricinus communis]
YKDSNSYDSFQEDTMLKYTEEISMSETKLLSIANRVTGMLSSLVSYFRFVPLDVVF